MRLATIYDQAGNARNFVPGSWAEMPLYDPAALYGASAKYGAFNSFNFDGWLQSPSTRRVKWARWPAGVATNRQTISVFDVHEPRTALYNSIPWNFTPTNGATSTNLGTILQADLPGWRAQHFSPHTTFSRRPRQNMQVIGLLNNSTNMRLLQDEQILTGTAASAQAIVGGTLGVAANGNAGTTDYLDRSHRLAFVVYGTALSDANAAAVRDALNATFGIATNDNQIVLVGSSSLFGASVTTSLEGRSPVRSVRPALTGNPALYNMGLSSQRLTGTGHLADLSATREDLLAADGNYGRRVLFIQIGANDLNSFGETPGYAATLYSAMEAYVSARRAAGFSHVVICTIPPRTSFLSGQRQTEWLAYNDLVRANSAGADVICDLASHPVMGLPASVSDLALYQDGIHPTGAGNDLVALTGSPVGGHPVNYRDALNQALAG